MFVKTTRGGYVALSAITHTSIHHDGDRTITIYWGGDHEAQVWEHQWKKVIRMGQPLIPAQPNTYALTYLPSEGDDDPDFVSRDCVLAWRADEYGLLDPVGLDSWVGDEFKAILLPDGKVVIPEDETFDSVDDYKAGMAARLARERDAKK